MLESDDIEGGEDEDEEGVRTPKVGTVIIDQLRKIKFEPYRLWQPPLTQPVAIDDLVNRFSAARGTRSTVRRAISCSRSG